MLRIGIAGLGFMGKMHFKCYNALDNAKVVAICDIDERKITAADGTAGNIAGTEQPLDLSGIELFADFDKMLAETKLDALSITLPTYMHRDFTVKALNAGVNVLCEKPMAMNITECQDMLTAVERTGKFLLIGHCIRFWPEYAKAKQIIDSGEYGKVSVATFRRLSLTPTWSWNNWIVNASKSGGALLDMHIHDSDFVQYLFGMPKAVNTHGVKGPSGGFDHITTTYVYDDLKLVTAEGGWMMAPGFGFEMSFNIILEKCTIVYDCKSEPAFKICPKDGDAFTVQLPVGDGYSLEIEHFVKTIAGEKLLSRTTPKQSLDTIKLILAEKESAQTGKEVTIQ